MDLARLAWTDLLLGFVLSHQPLGLVDGLDLLLQSDVGLRRLLGAGHASRVAVPRDLVTGNGSKDQTRRSNLESSECESSRGGVTFSSGFWISSSPIFLPMAVSSTPKISVRLSASCFRLLSISKPGA